MANECIFCEHTGLGQVDTDVEDGLFSAACGSLGAGRGRELLGVRREALLNIWKLLVIPRRKITFSFNFHMAN